MILYNTSNRWSFYCFNHILRNHNCHHLNLKSLKCSLSHPSPSVLSPSASSAVSSDSSCSSNSKISLWMETCLFLDSIKQGLLFAFRFQWNIDFSGFHSATLSEFSWIVIKRVIEDDFSLFLHWLLMIFIWEKPLSHSEVPAGSDKTWSTRLRMLGTRLMYRSFTVLQDSPWTLWL